jgi:hypothetical protein
MNNSKFALVTIAVVAIGLFALPSSISLFSGQHAWYDLGNAGSQVPCEKCHAEIRDEMVSTGAHEGFTCECCHRTDAAVGSYAGESGETGTGAHAASTEDCMICHDFEAQGHLDYTHDYIDPTVNCKACHPGFFGSGSPFPPTAGGLNLTTDPQDTGIKAAHKAFVMDSKDCELMVGPNEACISCHTRVGVSITWTKRENLNFNANEDVPGVWTIQSFTASGEDITMVTSPNSWTDRPKIQKVKKKSDT